MYVTILAALLVIGQMRVDERWEKLYEEDVVAETVLIGGGVSGDFNDNANWSNQSPDSTHTPAICDGTSQMDLTTNLNRGTDQFRLVTTPQYSGGIGVSGTPLIWNGSASETSLVHRGTGIVWAHLNSANGRDVVLDSSNMNVVTLILVSTAPTGRIRELAVKWGRCQVLGAVSFVGRVIVVGNQSHCEILPIAAAEAAPDHIAVHGGWVINKRIMEDAGDSIRLTSGKVDQTGVLENSVELHVTGGLMTYNPGEDVSAKTPVLTILDGIFDARASAYPIGFGKLIKGPSAHILGDVQGTVIPTLDLFLEYP